MSYSDSVGYNTLKSVLFTYSKTRLGVFDCWSRTMSSSFTMLGPPHKFCKILISRLIFQHQEGTQAHTQRNKISIFSKADQHKSLQHRCPNSIFKKIAALLAYTIMKQFGKHLFLLDRLKNLDDTALIVECVDTFKHFTVLATSHLPYHLIVILVPEIQ